MGIGDLFFLHGVFSGGKACLLAWHVGATRSAAFRSSEAWLVRVSQSGNLDSVSRIPSSMEMRCHVHKGR
jgi:hypothetical protein